MPAVNLRYVLKCAVPRVLEHARWPKKDGSGNLSAKRAKRGPASTELDSLYGVMNKRRRCVTS